MLDLFQPAADSSDLHDPGGRMRVRWPADSVITPRFSDCGQYRWELHEIWDQARPLWLWLMMNPSVASLRYSDMTVQKTGQISRLGGAGGQIIVNTGAYRSTSPEGLLSVTDPIGPENEATILRLAPTAARIMMAYGKPPKALAGVGLELARRLHLAGHQLHVLGLSADGTPKHPLARGKAFVPVTVTPQAWVPPAA